ncbi:MAG: hypothetical protein LBC28_03750, partial [Oscillospiraceae bacterium]|nr:hypothetical protein [Oscillospiraceae bacterium]
MKKLCLCLACLIMLSACRAAAPDVSPPPEETPEGGVSPIGEVTPPESGAMFDYLMDVLLADGGENSCVSPLSYKLALAMAYNGADGVTEELLQTLFGASPDDMNAWAQAYLESAKTYDGKTPDKYSPPKPELRIANSYWLRRGLESEISEDFTALLADSYNAESGRFDNKPDPINK